MKVALRVAGIIVIAFAAIIWANFLPLALSAPNPNDDIGSALAGLPTRKTEMIRLGGLAIVVTGIGVALVLSAKSKIGQARPLHAEHPPRTPANQRLAEIDKLLRAGLISQQEYDLKRKRILEEI